MIFFFWCLVAVAYLLTVAVLFSALFAWWAEQAKHKAAQLQLARIIAARKLGRYWHWPSCNCGLLTVGGLVHVDSRCRVWTEAKRRQRVAEQERKAAEKKTTRELPRVVNPSLN